MFHVGDKVQVIETSRGPLAGLKGQISSQHWGDYQMVNLPGWGSIAVPLEEMRLIPELYCVKCSVWHYADEACDCLINAWQALKAVPSYCEQQAALFARE